MRFSLALVVLLNLIITQSGMVVPPPVTISTEGPSVLINGESFFPIISWAQCAPEVEENLGLGVNVFMGSSCDESELVKTINGRAYIVADYRNGRDLRSYPTLIGYYLPDEPDSYGILPEDLPLTRRTNETGYLVFQTYTAQFTDPPKRAKYLAYLSNIDVAGFDLYPLAHSCGNPLIGLPQVYHYQRELIGLASGKPTYQWIEVNALEGFCGRDPVDAIVVRVEAWLAIAAGATGLGYFTHGWPEGIWRHFHVSSEVIKAVAETNEEIQSLASMLLAGQIPGIYSSLDDPVKIGGRSYRGKTYIIAVNATAKTASWSRKLPGLGNQLVSIHGEERNLRTQNKRLKDSLRPYQVRIYIYKSPARKPR